MSEASVAHLPLNLGVAWSPECLAEDQWADEIARLKESAVSCVRLFEFAWHRFEPREWEFDFHWATRLLDLLRDAGLRVILATPTSAPPAWLAAKYPECLAVGPDGRRATFGVGRYGSAVSTRYREFCTRIVDQMVHAFRGHDSIMGWQIDHQLRGDDYGNEARRLFHGWLHERFGSVDNLNNTWGLEYRSGAYEYFEQVPVPVGNGFHPSLLIAYRRFLNDQWSTFVQSQVEVIRGGFETPLAINMGSDWHMNYFRQNQLVDRVGVSLSEVEGIERSLMWFDRMRAEKPGSAYWAMDAAPAWRGAHRGSVDEVLAQTWLALLMGGELLAFTPWRSPIAGGGKTAGAVVSASGKWSSGRNAVTRAAAMIRQHAAWLEAHPPVEARVAVVMSNESAWAFAAEPPEESFDYPTTWRDEFYTPLVRAHIWRDVIDQNADFCPYHVIVMPLTPMVYRPTRERLVEWVDGGGCLLLGPLTGYRTEEFAFPWSEQEFSGLERLMGAACAGLAPATGSSVEWAAEDAEGATVPSSTPTGLAHGFEPTTAHVLARYKGGHLDGQAAILMNKLGQGTVITLGARVDRETYLDLVHTLCELTKVTPLATGSGDVAVIPRMNVDTSIAAYALVNLTAQEQMVTLTSAGTDRLTGHARGPEVMLNQWEVVLLEVEGKPAEIPSEPLAQASPTTPT